MSLAWRKDRKASTSLSSPLAPQTGGDEGGDLVEWTAFVQVRGWSPRKLKNFKVWGLRTLFTASGLWRCGVCGPVLVGSDRRTSRGKVPLCMAWQHCAATLRGSDEVA